ncbi:uncharacterized protein LOC116337853 [Contarinia nasturtii]|uniref:uncharacterized protein LOC116337853 n=1 Tax=Contarinia nasturtii TaxID=265458 RepID=UPI0012D48C9F|nr:uncharacterized protein LOC116337853 [Contarinia nasturtii]
MNVSLDDYIRDQNDGSKMDYQNMSLDEIIHMRRMNVAANAKNEQNGLNGVSKFDRYAKQDDHEMDDEDDLDNNGYPKDMPKLVPFEAATLPKRKPIYERLGQRGGERASICESIHTSQLKLYREKKFKAKNSVQNRLNKSFVSPAVKERNRITLHGLNTLAKSVGKNVLPMIEDISNQIMLNAVSRLQGQQQLAIQAAPQPQQKYDMQLQKDIASLQGKELYYACPGGFVVSSDGPGLRGQLNVPTHQTGISLNQRFA